MMQTKIQAMRALLNSGKIIVSPGVFDGYSARLIEKKGYKACAVSGAGLSNSRLERAGYRHPLTDRECRGLRHARPQRRDPDDGRRR